MPVAGEYQLAALFGGQATPDTVLLADLQGVTTTRLQYRTGLADLFGPLLPPPLLGAPLKARRRKEDGMVRSSTGCGIVPRTIMLSTAHWMHKSHIFPLWRKLYVDSGGYYKNLVSRICRLGPDSPWPHRLRVRFPR